MNESVDGRIAPVPDRQVHVGTPLVSVLMITYNHALFIRKAVDSVLAQRTDFPIELVIGEDCSTDETRKILKEYPKDGDVSIRLLENDRNLGMHENFRRTLAACTGKYIALLEGDDYWTEPGKLEQQVQLLESNPDYSFCFHRATWVYLDSTPRLPHAPEHGELFPSTSPPVLDFEQFANEVCIPTASVVYRRALLPGFPKWVDHIPWCDWVIFLLLADHGNAAFLPDVMSVYQRHLAGANSCSDSVKIHSGAYLMFKSLMKTVADQHVGTCQVMVVRHLEFLAEEYERRGCIGDARRTLVKSFLYGLRFGEFRRRPIIWLFRLAFPRTHRFVHSVRSYFSQST